MDIKDVTSGATNLTELQGKMLTEAGESVCSILVRDSLQKEVIRGDSRRCQLGCVMFIPCYRPADLPIWTPCKQTLLACFPMHGIAGHI